MISIIVKNMYGTSDYAPLALILWTHETPRAALGANDLRTFGALITNLFNFIDRH